MVDSFISLFCKLPKKTDDKDEDGNNDEDSSSDT